MSYTKLTIDFDKIAELGKTRSGFAWTCFAEYNESVDRVAKALNWHPWLVWAYVIAEVGWAPAAKQKKDHNIYSLMPAHYQHYSYPDYNAAGDHFVKTIKDRRVGDNRAATVLTTQLWEAGKKVGAMDLKGGDEFSNLLMRSSLYGGAKTDDVLEKRRMVHHSVHWALCQASDIAKKAAPNLAVGGELAELNWKLLFSEEERKDLIISSGFGMRTSPFKPGATEFHPGIDICPRLSSLFKEGKYRISVTFDAEVVQASWAVPGLIGAANGGLGNFVLVATNIGGRTLFVGFVHLYGSLDVKAQTGQKLKKGDTIGSIGSTGGSTGPHLHLECRWGPAWEDRHKIRFWNDYRELGASDPAIIMSASGSVLATVAEVAEESVSDVDDSSSANRKSNTVQIQHDNSDFIA